jgi:putative heme degradation protein
MSSAEKAAADQASLEDHSLNIYCRRAIQMYDKLVDAVQKVIYESQSNKSQYEPLGKDTIEQLENLIKEAEDEDVIEPIVGQV